MRKDTGHPDIFAAIAEEADRAFLCGRLRERPELCARPDPAPLLAVVKKLVPACKTVSPSCAVTDGAAGLFSISFLHLY